MFPDFDPNEAYKVNDRDQSSEDQSPHQLRQGETEARPTGTRRRRPGLAPPSQTNNFVARTITAIQKMNHEIVNNLYDDSLNRVIKAVWREFMKSTYSNKKVLMALFDENPDPELMISFGFGQWAHHPELSIYKRAMMELKKLILSRMGHQEIRKYIYSRQRIKNKPFLIAYIWQFLCVEFVTGAVKKKPDRESRRNVQAIFKRESEEDRSVGEVVHSSGSQVQVHFHNNNETQQ